MMKFLKSLFAYENANFAPWEWHIMRLAFGSLLIWWAPGVSPHTAQPRPNGLAHWVDLTFLSNEAVGNWMHWIYIAAVILYILNLGQRIVIPLITLMGIAYGSLGNSQGAINHVSQIIYLTLMAQAFGIWYSTIKFGKLEKRKADTANTMVSVSNQAIAAAYVVSAISKLVNSDGKWIEQVPNIIVQFAKNVDMSFYNTVSHEGHEKTMQVIEWVSNNPNLARILFGTGLVLELVAVLALLNRKMALLLGVSLILMHESISEIMHLGFFWNKALLLIFYVNIPFWLWKSWQSMRKQPA